MNLVSSSNALQRQAPPTISHQARKRFGQNFLNDSGVIHQIIADINPHDNDCIVEIGPGLGALTLPLLSYSSAHLSVIEIDKDLVAYWKSYESYLKQHDLNTLNVIDSDALSIDFIDLYQLLNNKNNNNNNNNITLKPLRIVGNLPYNISTPLLFHLQSALTVHAIQDQHFMLQKEVVERMVAQAGSSEFGRLSVMLQATYAMTCLQTVAPTAFDPPPKVWSAIVRMIPLKEPLVDMNDEPLWRMFSKLVALAFSQRRKMLRSVLKAYTIELEQAGILGTVRAQEVSVQQFAQLARLVLMR